MSFSDHDVLAGCCLALGIQLLGAAVLLAAAFRTHPKIAAGRNPKLSKRLIYAAAILLLPLLFVPWFSIPLVIAVAVSGAVVQMACWALSKAVGVAIPTYGRAVAVACVAFPAAAGAVALAVAVWAFQVHLSGRGGATALTEAVTIFTAPVLFLGAYALTSGAAAFMLWTSRSKAAAVMAFCYMTGLVAALGLALLPS